jgi:hypothetical protein
MPSAAFVHDEWGRGVRWGREEGKKKEAAAKSGEGNGVEKQVSSEGMGISLLLPPASHDSRKL